MKLSQAGCIYVSPSCVCWHYLCVDRTSEVSHFILHNVFDNVLSVALCYQGVLQWPSRVFVPFALLLSAHWYLLITCLTLCYSFPWRGCGLGELRNVSCQCRVLGLEMFKWWRNGSVVKSWTLAGPAADLGWFSTLTLQLTTACNSSQDLRPFDLQGHQAHVRNTDIHSSKHLKENNLFKTFNQYWF